MASGAPTFKSTKETTNYARLCRLMVDVGTQALRDTFDAFHPSANLHAVLVGNKATLQVLKKRNVINATQWGELFPTISSSVSSANFDITLLMVLLRNLCGLPSPATGWDKLPAVTDVSREADIARIKYYRNTVYGHAARASVDDATFNANWGDIRDTLVRLGGVKYRADIDKLETEVMDPDLDDHYRGLLQQWKKDEDNVKDQLNEVKKKLDDLKSTVKDLKADELLNTVRHTPMSVGLRDMSAEINGEPLTGSLRKVQVTGHPKALHSFRSPGKGQGEFDVPCSIAVSERTGNIAIAGFSNRRVQLFNSEWKYLRTIGDKEPSAGGIGHPTSVAFTTSGNVIAIHGSLCQPQKMSLFTENGQFIKHISQHLIDPQSVSIRSDGHMIVCDASDKSVKVLSPDGTKLVQSFNAPDCDKCPGYALYHEDKFFVSYYLAHDVKVFNKRGELQYSIGMEGSRDEQLDGHLALAIDRSNNLIVCDSEDNRLQVFSLDGKFINSFNAGTDSPWSVTVTKDNKLLVSGIGKNVINIFQ